MTKFHFVKIALALLLATVAGASPISQGDLAQARDADVVLLGEVHDNADHHDRQAAFVRALSPAALVFEMLSTEQAAAVTPMLRTQPEALAEALQWTASGWPDFTMYAPIFAASGTAKIVGAAVPRSDARAAMASGIAAAFGDGAEAYGLTTPLPDEEQARREAFQMAAHCDALPVAMLPMMVDIQRLRDAVLARGVITALDSGARPVVVITGNGHARRDGGVATYVLRVRPEVRIFALGQSEEGRIDGTFDGIADSPAVERDDPCAAFNKTD